MLLYASMIVLVVIALVLLQRLRKPTAPPAPADAQVSQAKAAPASAPTRPATRTRPAATRPRETGTSNVSPAAIKLTRAEMTAFGDVNDRDDKLDETAFYMLLGRAGKLPKLDREGFEALPRPAMESVLARPRFHRAQPMRVRLRVFALRKWMPGKEMSYSRYWPKDKPIWRINALTLVPAEKRPHPVVAFCLEDPTPLLGKPEKKKVTGELEYSGAGSRLDLAAVFYKIYTTEDLRGNQRDYLVFVAWQMAPGSKMDKKGATTMLTAIIGTILILLAGLIFLKRYIAHVKKGDGEEERVRYRPLRDLDAETDRASQSHEADEAQAAEELQALANKASRGDEHEAREGEDDVDPLLKQAAEEFRKERQQGDGTDRRG